MPFATVGQKHKGFVGKCLVRVIEAHIRFVSLGSVVEIYFVRVVRFNFFMD